MDIDWIAWGAALNYEWKHYSEKTWEDVIPAPHRQYSDILPKDFEGSCAVHAYSEVLTGCLRLGFGTHHIAVDHKRLLHLAAGKGHLTNKGSSLNRLNGLATDYGIPLDGEIPAELKHHPNYKLVDAHAEAYAINTEIRSFLATPMPFSNVTPEVAMKVIKCREHICDLLNCGPVVLCFKLQDHYSEPREEGVPYCRVEERKPWFSFTPRAGHCVTAYGYQCPGGDVRSLRILYQDNMTGAPTVEPGRLVIHPDAVDTYHVPYINNVLLSNTPSDGYMKVEQPPPHEEPSWLEKVIKNIF